MVKVHLPYTRGAFNMKLQVQKTCISNALDGTENYVIWKDYSPSASEDSNKEDDY